MKNAFIVSLFLFGLNSHADHAKACSNFISCGTYEGTGHWYDSNNQKQDKMGYSERIEINPINENSVQVKVYIYRGSLPQQPWADALLTFQPKGQFVMTMKNGGEFGRGYCSQQVCTLAFSPSEGDDEKGPFSNSFVNILRFEGNALNRYNMVSNGLNVNQLLFQRSQLTKK